MCLRVTTLGATLHIGEDANEDPGSYLDADHSWTGAGRLAGAHRTGAAATADRSDRTRAAGVRQRSGPGRLPRLATRPRDRERRIVSAADARLTRQQRERLDVQLRRAARHRDHTAVGRPEWQLQQR